MRKTTNSVRGVSLLWVILLLAGAAVAGAKLWSDAKKRQREEIAALEQRRQTTSTIDRERRDFEAKIAAEKEKSAYARSAEALVAARARWSDALKIAGATSRVALATPIANLQAIRREADTILLPDCLSFSRKKLVDGMQLQIDGFLLFMGNPGELGKLLSSAKFEDGDKLMDESKADAERCAPVT